MNEAKDYLLLIQELSLEITNKEIIKSACTHRSVITRKSDYERLEFLGDAVLDLCIAHILSELYQDATEGELTKMRASLVNERKLSEIAKKIELGKFIHMAKSEFASGGSEKPSILADVLEAIVGAVYIDQGFDYTFAFIKRLYDGMLDRVDISDPKSELQEFLHAQSNSLPEYVLVRIDGPDHQPNFVMNVVLNGEVIGRGEGGSKKSATQAAASDALKQLAAGQ
jgi:ribonuclease-3